MPHLFRLHLLLTHPLLFRSLLLQGGNVLLAGRDRIKLNLTKGILALVDDVLSGDGLAFLGRDIDCLCLVDLVVLIEITAFFYGGIADGLP